MSTYQQILNFLESLPLTVLAGAFFYHVFVTHKETHK